MQAALRAAADCRLPNESDLPVMERLTNALCPSGSAGTLAAVSVGLVLGTLVSATPVRAQQRVQDVEIVTTVESGQPTRVFLDSLGNEIRMRDSVRVRREPGGDRMSLDAIQSTLIEEGIGLLSANRLFLEYAFEIRNNEFIKVIQSPHFIFRPEGTGEEDLSVLYVTGLYVTGNLDFTREVLKTQGIPNPQNLGDVALFKDELPFASLSLDRGADMVSVAGTPVRSEFDRRRKRVLQRFKNLFGGVSAACDFADLAPRSHGTRPVAPLQGSLERSVDASPAVSRRRIHPPNRF